MEFACSVSNFCVGAFRSKYHAHSHTYLSKLENYYQNGMPEINNASLRILQYVEAHTEKFISAFGSLFPLCILYVPMVYDFRLSVQNWALWTWLLNVDRALFVESREPSSVFYDICVWARARRCNCGLNTRARSSLNSWSREGNAAYDISTPEKNRTFVEAQSINKYREWLYNINTGSLTSWTKVVRGNIKLFCPLYIISSAIIENKMKLHWFQHSYWDIFITDSPRY